jgi:hypothetical protein
MTTCLVGQFPSEPCHRITLDRRSLFALQTPIHIHSRSDLGEPNEKEAWLDTPDETRYSEPAALWMEALVKGILMEVL